MAKRDYKVGDKIVMNINFSPRSKYYQYAGMQGRITYVNRPGSYDLDLDGRVLLDYVDSKIFHSADDLKTPEQKREVLKKNLTARRSDAEKVIEEKKALIADLNDRLNYIVNNESVVEIDETAYMAWKIALKVKWKLSEHERLCEERLEGSEFTNVVSGLVYNILKTTNK